MQLETAQYQDTSLKIISILESISKKLDILIEKQNVSQPIQLTNDQKISNIINKEHLFIPSVDTNNIVTNLKSNKKKTKTNINDIANKMKHIKG